MTDKELFKLALDALENSVDLVSNEAREAEKMYANVPTRLARVQGLIAIEVAHEKAITALKERLENPMYEVQRLGQEIEQEPICPACKAEVLYECVACSSNNYPPQRTEQEPLGHIASMALNDMRDGIYGEVRVYSEELGGSVPIYTHPPQRTEQEPVAWINAEKRTFEWNGPVLWNTPTVAVLNKIPLYTHPPQRTWVGLTFAEICECENDYLHLFARAIEAKLKQKNGYAEEKNT